VRLTSSVYVENNNNYYFECRWDLGGDMRENGQKVNIVILVMG